MRAVAESLFTPRTFRNAAALQEDAVRAALKAFGLGPDDQALSLELFEGRETALARITIMEDSVIEHDAIMIDVPLRIVHCDVPLSGPPLRINVHPTDDAIRRGIDVAFSI